MADYDLSSITTDTDGPAADAEVLFGSPAAGTPKPYSFAGIKAWIKSWFAVADLKDVAWSTWSPTFTMSTVGGTPITAAVTGTGARYKEIGKTVHFTIDARISNVGVGNSGAFIISLPPVTAFDASAAVIGSGKEVSTIGKLVSLVGWSATEISVNLFDNTSLLDGGNGTRVLIGGFYEAA